MEKINYKLPSPAEAAIHRKYLADLRPIQDGDLAAQNLLDEFYRPFEQDPRVQKLHTTIAKFKEMRDELDAEYLADLKQERKNGKK